MLELCCENATVGKNGLIDHLCNLFTRQFAGKRRQVINCVGHSWSLARRSILLNKSWGLGRSTFLNNKQNHFVINLKNQNYILKIINNLKLEIFCKKILNIMPKNYFLMKKTFTWFPCIDISFCYFYRFSIHTQMYCKNLRVKISNIKVSTGLWKLPKLDLGCVSFFLLSFFSHFSSPDF